MMRDDVSGELSLAELGQSVNLSAWRLCHIFKSDVGMPPIRYLKLLRMERAKQLLETSFLSVKEIAFRVGLNDESHFVRDFKATYGSTPTSYRTCSKNGSGASNGDEKKDRPLVKAAKQSVLPTIHLIASLSSLF
jgi:AraC-like DNA-binding protein